MYKIGDTVKIIHDGSIGAVISVSEIGDTIQYRVLLSRQAFV